MAKDATALLELTASRATLYGVFIQTPRGSVNPSRTNLLDRKLRLSLINNCKTKFASKLWAKTLKAEFMLTWKRQKYFPSGDPVVMANLMLLQSTTHVEDNRVVFRAIGNSATAAELLDFPRISVCHFVLAAVTHAHVS